MSKTIWNSFFPKEDRGGSSGLARVGGMCSHTDDLQDQSGDVCGGDMKWQEQGTLCAPGLAVGHNLPF